jgi:hypothetical protein
VAVRVIRGSFANDVVGQPVELQVLGVNGLMLEEKTDAAGGSVSAAVQRRCDLGGSHSRLCNRRARHLVVTPVDHVARASRRGFLTR